MSKQRFSFKTNVKYDIALLCEIESTNPYEFEKNKIIWEEIAKKLHNSPLKMAVTERSCRERAAALIKAFKLDEALSQRASGIEEDELDELKKLMISVTSLYEAKKFVKSKDPSAAKRSRQEAEKIRDLALLNASTNDDDPVEVEDGASNEVADNEENIQNMHGNATDECRTDETPPKKRVRKGDVLGYLEKKNADKQMIKMEEIALRKVEANNKKMEIDMQNRKLDLEHQAKIQELNLRKIEIESQAQERSAMSQMLLKLLSKKE